VRESRRHGARADHPFPTDASVRLAAGHAGGTPRLIVEEGRRIFGSCGTEFGFLPCAVAADHISTCGDPWHLTMCKPEWPIMALIDRRQVVPVW
jgi:hypothetical protein